MLSMHISEDSFLQYLRAWITQVNIPRDISETPECSYIQPKTRQAFKNINGLQGYQKTSYPILEVPIFLPIKSSFSERLHQSAVSYIRLSSQLLRGTQASHQRQLRTHNQWLQTEKATGDSWQTSSGAATGPLWGRLHVSWMDSTFSTCLGGVCVLLNTVV